MSPDLPLRPSWVPASPQTLSWSGGCCGSVLLLPCVFCLQAGGGLSSSLGALTVAPAPVAPAWCSAVRSSSWPRISSRLQTYLEKQMEFVTKEKSINREGLSLFGGFNDTINKCRYLRTKLAFKMMTGVFLSLVCSANSSVNIIWHRRGGNTGPWSQ